jgi:translation elongation factor EF-4
VHHPADLPGPVRIDHIEQPSITATILAPDAYLRPIPRFVEERRGDLTQLDGYAEGDLVLMNSWSMASRSTHCRSSSIGAKPSGAAERCAKD